MNLEQLKKKVMLQAMKKGFGTKLEDIIVPEKILLIASEVEEAEFFDREYHKMCNAIVPADVNWRNNPNLPESTRSALTHVRNEYMKEMSDILQRTLHLGGIFRFPFPQRKVKDDGHSMYQMILATYNQYRHKKMPEFERGLVNLANYCVQVTRGEFDIYQVTLGKIEENKERVWNSSKLNERLAPN